MAVVRDDAGVRGVSFSPEHCRTTGGEFCAIIYVPSSLFFTGTPPNNKEGANRYRTKYDSRHFSSETIDTVVVCMSE